VHSADGGHATAEKVQSRLGVDNMVHKTIGNCKFEDFSLQVGTGMSPAFYEWIKASFDKQPFYQDGVIHTCDDRYMVRRRHEFQQALVSEIGFPALDASSNNTDAKMNIKFRPTRAKVHHTPNGTDKIDPSAHPIDGKKQKKWSPRDFRLRLDGMDDASMASVCKIEGLTLKQKYAEDHVGEHRIYDVIPATLDVPDLSVTFSEAFGGCFYDWHEDFLINGLTHLEKTATLEFLSPARTNTDANQATARGNQGGEVLFTLTLQGLGIYKLTPEKVESSNEQVRRIKADMYCEQIAFQYNPTATFGHG
jgi:hypothetical protein